MRAYLRDWLGHFATKAEAGKRCQHPCCAGRRQHPPGTPVEPHPPYGGAVPGYFASTTRTDRAAEWARHHGADAAGAAEFSAYMARRAEGARGSRWGLSSVGSYRDNFAKFQGERAAAARPKLDRAGHHARRGDLVVITTTETVHHVGKPNETRTRVEFGRASSVSKDHQVTAFTDVYGTRREVKRLGPSARVLISHQEVTDVDGALAAYKAHHWEGHPNQVRPYESLEEARAAVLPFRGIQAKS